MALARRGRVALVPLALGFCLALGATRAHAVPIVFDLRGVEGLAIDGATSGVSIVVSGLTATFTHNDPGAGVFNQTASAFGVNAALAGDVTDQLDAGAGFAEAVSVSFNLAVNLRGVGVSSFGATDMGGLSLNAGALTDSITATGAYAGPLIGALIPAGSDLTLAYVAGNGFSYDRFSVEIVPEPGSAALLGLGVLALGVLRARGARPQLRR